MPLQTAAAAAAVGEAPSGDEHNKSLPLHISFCFLSSSLKCVCACARPSEARAVYTTALIKDRRGKKNLHCSLEEDAHKQRKKEAGLLVVRFPSFPLNKINTLVCVKPSEKEEFKQATFNRMEN